MMSSKQAKQQAETVRQVAKTKDDMQQMKEWMFGQGMLNHIEIDIDISEMP